MINLGGIFLSWNFSNKKIICLFGCFFFSFSFFLLFFLCIYKIWVWFTCVSFINFTFFIRTLFHISWNKVFFFLKCQPFLIELDLRVNSLCNSFSNKVQKPERISVLEFKPVTLSDHSIQFFFTLNFDSYVIYLNVCSRRKYNVDW